MPQKRNHSLINQCHKCQINHSKIICKLDKNRIILILVWPLNLRCWNKTPKLNMFLLYRHMKCLMMKMIWCLLDFRVNRVKLHKKEAIIITKGCNSNFSNKISRVEFPEWMDLVLLVQAKSHKSWMMTKIFRFRSGVAMNKLKQ